MAKESAKRGYMTKTEVEEHLRGIESDRAKMGYLTDVLTKKKLLAKETQNAIYTKLGELYESVEKSYGGVFPRGIRKEGHFIVNDWPYAGMEKTKREFKSLIRDLKNKKLYEDQRDHLLWELKQNIEHMEDLGYGLQAKLARKKVERTSRKWNLESTTSVIASIASIGLGIFFLQPSMTASVIGPTTASPNSVLGLVLLVMGLVGSFFSVRKMMK